MAKFVSRSSSYNLSLESRATVRFLPLWGGGEDAIVEEEAGGAFCCGLPTMEASISILAILLLDNNRCLLRG